MNYMYTCIYMYIHDVYVLMMKRKKETRSKQTNKAKQHSTPMHMYVLLTLFVCVVDIEETDVVPVNVGKPHLRLVSLFPLVPRPNEDLRN